MKLEHPAFERLPKKLTISFPLWLLFDTPGETAAYHDLEKIVQEHVERGFNCIRIDDGAGLTHDLSGTRREPFEICDVFGEYEKVPRQQGCLGDGGKCDLLARLIELCQCAKKHGVYLILSSWYFLHTYWYHAVGDKIADEIFGIPAHERFAAFAKFHDYILMELESRQLDSRIAFVEVFNEANGLPFVNGYGNRNNLSEEELAQFRQEHEAALKWLQERHPQILFAYDSYTPWDDVRQIPQNMQVYNFHSYFMWSVYDNVLNEHTEFFQDRVTEDDVRLSRQGRRPAASDWYERVALYNNLDKTKIPDLEKLLEKRLQKDYDKYLEAVDNNLLNIKQLLSKYPGIPVVCGEGVSYIGSKELLWEEHSEKYWELVETVIKKYKEFGMWGTVIRTCCGPEDPCWDMCADKLKKLNDMFLE